MPAQDGDVFWGQIEALMAPQKGPIRYAVVGLGHIAQVAILPAFAHAKVKSGSED